MNGSANLPRCASPHAIEARASRVRRIVPEWPRFSCSHPFRGRSFEVRLGNEDVLDRPSRS
jgi:hypothetical protein